MKLYDPATEKSLESALRDLVAVSKLEHKARALQWNWPDLSMLKQWFWMVISQLGLTAFLLVALGATHENLRTPGSQRMVIGLWFLASAGFFSSTVIKASFHSNEAHVLWMLPVAGESILWRAMSRSVLHYWPTLLRAWLVCWWLYGAPKSLQPLEVGAWVVSGTALWLITLSFAAVERHRFSSLLGLDRIWNLLRIAAPFIIIGLVASESYRWNWLPLHSLLESISPALVWLLPAAWILPTINVASFGPDWLIASCSIGVVVLGLHQWMQWPKQAAPVFDSVTTDIDNVQDYQVAEDDWAAEASRDLDHQANPIHEVATVSLDLITHEMSQTEATSLAQRGWIERLVSRTFSARDRAILPVLMHRPPVWSKHWWLALKATLAVLGFIVLADLILHAGWISDARLPAWLALFAKMRTWLSVVLGLGVVVATVPIGGSVSDSVTSWHSGSQALPFLCGFPITCNDLLRVSWKIIWVRTMIASLLVLPAAVMLGWLSAGIWQDGLTASSIAARILFIIASARPVLVMHRLGTVLQRRNADWIVWLICVVTAGLLSILWLLSTGLFIAFGAEIRVTGQLLGWLGGLVPLACTLGMYACFHWRLRRRGLDYAVVES